MKFKINKIALAISLMLISAAAMAAALPTEQTGFRLIQGEDINAIVSSINGFTGNTATPSGATGLTAGSSGNAGTITVFPSTSAKGKTTITASPNSGNTTTNINTAAQSGARTYTVPDGGANASFMLTQGAQTVIGAQTFVAPLTMSTATSGLVLKQGSNGKAGTFVCTSGGTITISNTSIAITDAIIISLNTVGGTISTTPAVNTITATTGFTAKCATSDTSTYNYAIISNAP